MSLLHAQGIAAEGEHAVEIPGPRTRPNKSFDLHCSAPEFKIVRLLSVDEAPSWAVACTAVALQSAVRRIVLDRFEGISTVLAMRRTGGRKARAVDVGRAM